MKKKTTLILLIALGLFTMSKKATAQDSKSTSSIWEELTKVSTKSDKFNLFLNMNGSLDAADYGDFSTKFNMRQLRIEAKGQLTDRLSYRYRHRLNRSNAVNNNIDNMPTSIDIAGLGVSLSDKFSMFLGKQCAAYGGIEFDLNPIEIYEYSDMIEYMSNFLTGVNLAYQVSPAHQLQLQILDSRNGSFSDTYGQNLVDNKIPMLFTLNWNGDFNDVFKTRWSASAMNESKSRQMYYFALGNELKVDKFNGWFDAMYSREGLDRKGIITDMVGMTNGHTAYDAEYLSFVLRLGYRFAPNWNCFVKGTYETASLSSEDNGKEKGKYRTSYGYLAGLEYFPMVNEGLHFFLTYVGRSYDYTSRATNHTMEDSNRVSLGLIWQIPLF